MRTSIALAMPVTLLALGWPAIGSTQEEKLYEPAPPPGAAFVRVINLTGAGEAPEVMIGESVVGTVGELQASPYHVVEERETPIALGDAEATAAIEPGRFFSIVARPGEDGIAITTLEDEPNTDRTKAQLALYNLTGEADVDLVTSDGKVVVFEDVAPDSATYRTVNAVTVGLSVKINGEVVATFEDVPLERGTAFGILVAGAAQDEVELIQAETRS
jgi:alginate O-acetyltransferase complex protein AlgF